MSIIVKDLYHTYQKGLPGETHALESINLEINQGDFLGIIGHTGSGKSTLVQHLNGLLKPSMGEVIIDGVNIGQRGSKLNQIRQKVGLVFQYPEHQLFEETVLKDVSFGPQNLGLSEKEVLERAKAALEIVELNFKEIKDKSPFNLSGGQKRRVAIAGVLAMEPEYLVLDEPTAGLDPRGREEILKQIKALHEKLKVTIIMVSHSMDEVARFANRIMVMDKGRIEMMGSPGEVFQEYLRLQKIGLDVPMVTKLLFELKKKGLDVKTDILEMEKVKGEILRALRKGQQDHA